VEVASSKRLAVPALSTRLVARLSLAGLGFALGTVPSSAFAAEPDPITFQRDVLPVLQRTCQGCHRPGDIGPMPLLTYEQTRPWAKAIRAAVAQGEMPPWHADPRYGVFANDRSLSESEVRTLVRWVDAGAPEGSATDAPPPKRFAEGWRIGEPDVVYEMPKAFDVPASGTVPYQWIMIPSGFAEDTWVEAVEVRPGNRSVVHHGVVYAREEGAEWAHGAPVGEFFDLFALTPPRRVEGNTMFSQEREPEHLEVFAPGADPIVLRPGQARLIKAGSYIVFEMHYTPNGEATTDRSSVGLVFAKQPPAERVRTIRIQNGVRISIPPGADDYRIESRVRLLRDVKVVSFMPHMHLRGKSMEFRATYPGGESEVLLSVPRFDFHWQMSYYLETPKTLPKGTLLTCSAAWDNSAGNPNNPDPGATVVGGLQSEEEMMAGFVELGIDPASTHVSFFADAPLEEPDAAGPTPRTATARAAHRRRLQGSRLLGGTP
jgi:hypothetical protein